MRGWRGGIVLGVAGLLTAGCATGEEWTTWRGHGAHFASKDHIVFSVRNGEGRKPRVSRLDIAAARAENWWGKAVTVPQDEVLER
jgi:hypothetical protein